MNAKDLNIVWPCDFIKKSFLITQSSMFLAGPTPRSNDVKSWRPEALDILAELNYSGFIFVPERSDWSTKFNYNSQIKWEWHGLDYCNVIVFWVPRRIPEMMALTTNVEFGLYVSSQRAIYGRPDGSPHTTYLDVLYRNETGNTPHSNLRSLLQEAVARA